MAEVYYYVPAKDCDYIIECGLKLSRWSEREILIEGVNKKCFSALLNPKDDMAKFNDDSLRCMKLDLPSEYCYVADKYLYEIGQNVPEIMKSYYRSIMPLEKYIFGLYRLPECLVTTTVIPGQADILNKAQDIPVLFNSSEELYINNLIEINKEYYEDFDDMVLYFFYSKLAEYRNITRLEDKNKRIAIFIENTNIEGTGTKSEKIYTIKLPKEITYMKNDGDKKSEI